jgi:ubiquinone/menaquinone biosynthesis C-methylase UbiE
MFQRRYSDEPAEPAQFTRRLDKAYTRFAGSYDAAVKKLPVWKTWLRHALPHVQGPRVLEVSFGTGYLLTRYAARFSCVGLDYNGEMIRTARSNLRDAGLHAPLVRGDVHRLPFPDKAFDCVVNTMALSGYPDATAALSEIGRVLEPGGRLVLIDIAYPAKRRFAGTLLTNLWKLSGDLIRDVPSLLRATGFEFSDEEIGGFGSVHLYVATRDTPSHTPESGP